MFIDLEVKKYVIERYGRNAIVNDCENVADVLEKSFKWTGSKISWSRTKGHKSATLTGDFEAWLIQINRFFLSNKIMDESNNEGEVYYINDSSLYFAVCIGFLEMKSFMAYALKNIPQHHYFFNQRAKWCLAVSSEGYVDFGYAD